MNISTDPSNCISESSPTETILSICIVIGLIVSYLPQHYRIISKKSSEGFSPWFLLLGTTSSTSSFLNVLLLQVDILRCCARQALSQCLANSLGIMQIGFQWLMFSILFILFMIYFPMHLKYISSSHKRVSSAWKSSIAISYIVASHLVLCSLLSAIFLFYGKTGEEVRIWAGFLGLCSTVLALFQYLPQIYTTYRRKSIGALSIPMMCLQTPGSFIFVYTLAVRPGVNVTTWLTFLVTGILQGTLLILCMIYKRRAVKMGLDDFTIIPEETPNEQASNEETPLLS